MPNTVLKEVVARKKNSKSH